MTTEVWVTTGWGSGSVPLFWLLIRLKAISQRLAELIFCIISCKVISLRLPHLSRANVLIRNKRTQVTIFRSHKQHVNFLSSTNIYQHFLLCFVARGSSCRAINLFFVHNNFFSAWHLRLYDENALLSRWWWWQLSNIWPCSHRPHGYHYTTVRRGYISRLFFLV